MIPEPPAPPLPPPLFGHSTGLPVGTVVAFLGEVAGASSDHANVTPIEVAGWMVCDGRTLDRRQYPELFAALGYRYSKSSEGDAFQIPDLRGYFLRGVDSSSGNDPDTASRKMVDGSTGAMVGSLQDCAFQLHEHSVTLASALSQPSPQGTQAGTAATMNGDTTRVVPEPGSSAPLRTSTSETRPKNLAVYYIIKFTSGMHPWAGLLGRCIGP